ncbi:hypothetical protein SEA_SUERTE_39 [Gordonia phage Suerte]|uniref:Uncharacterized protein n=1 Tax=Gordonia phage Suerte TaxID=2652883 RepID=A0A5P8DFS3_9CAUD|nr:hypothetical protein PP511_gp39 [Gordonia phage Suerte]QFP97010.1 hypothetical protein SEA_SUERTE_39 [Gordonia phage Suerte]
MSDDDERSRGDDGDCEWHEADPYTTERRRLENERNPADPTDATPWEVSALEFIDEVMAAASSSDGFDLGSYSAPMGRRQGVRQKNMPWIGEIKTPGVHRRDEGGNREYRMYFAEPNLSRALLAALLAYKTSEQTTQKIRNTLVPKSSSRQSAQIRSAAGIVRRWCKSKGVGWRSLR